MSITTTTFFFTVLVTVASLTTASAEIPQPAPLPHEIIILAECQERLINQMVLGEMIKGADSLDVLSRIGISAQQDAYKMCKNIYAAAFEYIESQERLTIGLSDFSNSTLLGRIADALENMENR